MEGVVQRGTATTLKSLNHTVAGKTGTTNDSKDVWFMGFTPDMVAGVFIGYDDPQPLGEKETGGSVAAPVFKDFMSVALAGKPDTPFRVPQGVQLIRVNPYSGLPAMSGEGIWEAYLPGTDPESSQASVLGGTSFEELPETGDPVIGPDGVPQPIMERPPEADIGTGGLY
jgi:penicillin-binding protein 1A